MGTQSLTVFEDEDGTEIVVMYRQMDGYPKGHGKDLAEFLARGKVVNGYSMQDQEGAHSERVVANGVGCLAAQVIAYFKQGIGNIYLYPAGKRDLGEEFVYTLYPATENIMLRVEVGDTTFFGLPGTKQSNMPVIYDGTIDAFDAEKAEALKDAEKSAGIVNDFVEAQNLEEES